jgi:DNA polymerase III delta prime subunit
MNSILYHPAHLWISDPETLEQNIIARLQKILCSDQGCLSCSTCNTIQEKIHPWIEWIEPEQNYTVELIDSVIKQTMLQLDPLEYRFFIFTRAEGITDHCANKLLKTIEEPHKNYYFIFLSQNKEAILPTIQSRCLLHICKSTTTEHTHQAIIAPLMNLQFDAPGEYTKLLTSSAIKEQESLELLQILFEFWAKKYKDQLNAQTNIAQKIVSIILEHIDQPIMPGSSKILWKNLYLALHQIACSKK